MTRLRRPAAILFAGLLLAAALLLAGAEAGAQPAEEHKAALRLVLDRTAYPPGSTARLAAVVAIDGGWHVNANPASQEFLIPTAVEAAGDGELRGVAYPTGERLRFAFAGDELAVYGGAVEIRGEVRPGDDTRLLVTYQACDDERCLPPVVREQFRFQWTPKRERHLRRTVAVLRAVRRGLPRWVAWWPAARRV